MPTCVGMTGQRDRRVEFNGRWYETMNLSLVMDGPGLP
jgi:hypothetical protein